MHIRHRGIGVNVTTYDYKTRRQMLRASLAAVGGVVAVTAAASAQEKIDPKMVQYQTTPKDGNKCSTCVNFEAPSTCKIVSGTIDPNGWCIAFAPKQS
jgi:hypothetical protein